MSPSIATAQPADFPGTEEARPVASAGIIGLGAALPSSRVGNVELAQRIGVTPEWIQRRTGIAARRRADPGQRLSDLASDAGRAALLDAGLGGADIDLLLVATITSDEITPASAPLVAYAIGAHRAAAVDVGAACAGSIAALAHATAWIECGRARNALVIGAEIMSRIVDHDDKVTAPLFGDGAGAVVVSSAAAGAFGPFVIASDGGAAGAIRVTRERGVVEMQGHETFLMAVDRLASGTQEVLSRAEVALSEVDLFIFHQANGRILAAVADRLGVARARVFDCVAELGNTSSASLPLALVKARRQGLLRPGARIVLGAVGAGLVWGTTVMTWGGS